MKINHEIQSPDEAEEIISAIKSTISSGINVGLGTYRLWCLRENTEFINALMKAFKCPEAADDVLYYDLTFILDVDILTASARGGSYSTRGERVRVGKIIIASQANWESVKKTTTLSLAVRENVVAIADKFYALPVTMYYSKGVIVDSRSFLSKGSCFPRKNKLFAHKKKCGEYRAHVSITLTNDSYSFMLEEVEKLEAIGGVKQYFLNMAAKALKEVIYYDLAGVIEVMVKDDRSTKLKIPYVGGGPDGELCFIYVVFKKFDDAIKKARGEVVFHSFKQRPKGEYKC